MMATELHQTVRAMSLDRLPLPQLSPGAWQLKARGIEVAAVRVWHEIKAQAVEVQRITADLTAQVREWLGWAAGGARHRPPGARAIGDRACRRA